MIVAGVWTGVGFSNLKNSRPGFKNFETGAESVSQKVTPITSGLNYYFFPPSALWHPCCLVPLLFGGGDDEPVSKFQAKYLLQQFLDGQWSMVIGLLFHMTQPTSKSIIKAIACSKPTISEHWSKWKHNGTVDQCKQRKEGRCVIQDWRKTVAVI